MAAGGVGVVCINRSHRFYAAKVLHSNMLDCLLEARMPVYQFQCNRCFIVSGRVSRSREDAPICCDGEPMIATVIPERNLTFAAPDLAEPRRDTASGRLEDAHSGETSLTASPSG